MTPEERGAILERYDRIRRQSKPLIQSLLAERRNAMPACAKELGLWDHGVLALGNENETVILMDFCMYYPIKGYRNVADRRLAESSANLNESERAILGGMAGAHYSVFEVLNFDPGLGVTVRDLIGGREHFVVDRGFSLSAHPADVLGMRIVTVEGVTHCTGAAQLTVAKAIDVLRMRLTRRLAQRLDEPGFVLGPHEQTLLARLVLTVCIKAGITDLVGYQ